MKTSINPFASLHILLKNKLKEIQKLKNLVEKKELENKDQFRNMILGIIEVVDTHENAKGSIFERNLDKENNSAFIIQRFSSVDKQLNRLLKKNGVTRLEFPENRLLVGFCRVIDTEPDTDLPDDTILEVVKSGYIRGKELIREAEVIIVKN